METNFYQLVALAEQEVPLMDKITPRTMGHRLNVGSNRAQEVIDQLVAQGVLESYHNGLGNKAYRFARQSAASETAKS